jgi:hypothetical protein
MGKNWETFMDIWGQGAVSFALQNPFTGIGKPR